VNSPRNSRSRTSRALSALAPTAASALAIGSIQVVASPAQAAGTLVFGTVASKGTPVSGAQVGLWAWPNAATLDALPDDADVPIKRIAITTTNSYGNYGLQPDLSQLPSSYFEPDGAISMELQSIKGSTAQSTSVPAARAGSAVAAEAAGDVVIDGGETATISFDTATHTVSSSLTSAYVSNEDGVGDLSSATSYSFVASNAIAARISTNTTTTDNSVVADPTIGMDPVSCSKVKAGGKLPNKPEHFVNVYAWSGAYGALTETDANSQTVGVGFAINDGAWSEHGQMGATTDVGNGITRSFAAEGTAVSNAINYRKFYQTCAFGNPVQYQTQHWSKATGSYALKVPALDKGKAQPNWTNCIKYNADATDMYKASGKNTTYSAGIQLGFLNLSANDTFTKNMKITWNPTQATWYCGSNGTGPAGAPQALAKKWTSGGGGCGVISNSTQPAATDPTASGGTATC